MFFRLNAEVAYGRKCLFFHTCCTHSVLIVKTMSSQYQTCASEHGEDTVLLIQCVSNWIETQLKDNSVNSPGFVASNFATAVDVTNWLLILTGSLVFFMQAGFAMVCAGAIRKKNVKNTVCMG
jgi:hypothetical protein